MSPIAAAAVATILVPILSSILASGLVASVITVTLNAREQRRARLRAKLEEAYAAAHDYCMMLRTHYIGYADVFKGKISINDANDTMIARGTAIDRTVYRRLEMLVEIYVPKARSALKDAIAVREQMAGTWQDYRSRYPLGDPVALNLLPRLQAALDRLDQVEQDFKQAIVGVARRL